MPATLDCDGIVRTNGVTLEMAYRTDNSMLPDLVHNEVPYLPGSRILIVMWTVRHVAAKHTTNLCIV